jgi:hypothetical protein
VSTIVQASTLLGASPPARYAKGRVCAHDGCGTILDPYNETVHCSIHQPEPDYVYCGYTVLICAHCGETVALSHPKAARSRMCGKCRKPREEKT